MSNDNKFMKQNTLRITSKKLRGLISQINKYWGGIGLNSLICMLLEKCSQSSQSDLLAASTTCFVVIFTIYIRNTIMIGFVSDFLQKYNSPVLKYSITLHDMKIHEPKVFRVNAFVYSYETVILIMIQFNIILNCAACLM